MSGTYKRLRPGRYQLVVDAGEGPAGIRRPAGENVTVGVEGGIENFEVDQQEEVYYWWRGPVRSRGVHLVSQHAPMAAPVPMRRRYQIAGS